MQQLSAPRGTESSGKCRIVGVLSVKLMLTRFLEEENIVGGFLRH